jgi:hypothetical protein
MITAAWQWRCVNCEARGHGAVDRDSAAHVAATGHSTVTRCGPVAVDHAA